jgi:hypothetical protein
MTTSRAAYPTPRSFLPGDTDSSTSIERSLIFRGERAEHHLWEMQSISSFPRPPSSTTTPTTSTVLYGFAPSIRLTTPIWHRRASSLETLPPFGFARSARGIWVPQHRLRRTCSAPSCAFHDSKARSMVIASHSPRRRPLLRLLEPPTFPRPTAGEDPGADACARVAAGDGDGTHRISGARTSRS